MSNLLARVSPTFFSAVRWTSGHRRDRPDGNQHSLRREDTGFGNDSCPNALGHRGLRGSAGQIHSAATVLAAILLVVSYNMGEWREIPELLKLSRMEIATWLVTFLLTVFADLTVAVETGMILAVLVFIRKVTQTTSVSEVTEEYVREGHVHILQHKVIPAYVMIFRIHGPFLFGATDKIEEITTRLSSLPPILILRLRNMTD